MDRTHNLFNPSLSLVILMAVSWWLGRRSTQPPQLATAPTQTALPHGTAPTGGEQEPDRRTIAVVLRRGLARGSEEKSKHIMIPPEVSQVRLEARVEVSYPRYEVVLQAAEGKRIWGKGDLEGQAFPEGKRIVTTLSSSLLPTGDYILTVRGLPAAGSAETVAEYAFRVEASQPGARAPISACSGVPRRPTSGRKFSEMFWPLMSLTGVTQRIAVETHHDKNTKTWV